MASPKDILVITTASADGLIIKKHLKPVIANVVAGTNVLSDFSAGLTDFFGGRSSSYQKQLTSLYNEAIERIKYNTHEIGGNCVIGLSVDMDEISGKGKSMFMLTAIGTAVVIEKEDRPNSLPNKDEIFENVGVERINNLRQRKEVIAQAVNNALIYNEEIWNFITANQVYEIFSFILTRYRNVILQFQAMEDAYSKFNKNFIGYVDALEESKKVNLLYDQIENETNIEIALYLSNVIKELYLYDFERNMILLKNKDFKKQKIGLRILSFDKPFYNKKDVSDLKTIENFIKETFKERGVRGMQKGMFSSNEREIWVCECESKKEIEIGKYCGRCENDIFGFKIDEKKPSEIISNIEEKIELINEFLE